MQIKNKNNCKNKSINSIFKIFLGGRGKNDIFHMNVLKYFYKPHSHIHVQLYMYTLNMNNEQLVISIEKHAKNIFSNTLPQNLLRYNIDLVNHVCPLCKIHMY